MEIKINTEITINELLEAFRQFVKDSNYKTNPILSAYVNIDPSNPANQNRHPAWTIELKDEEKKIAKTLPPKEIKRRASRKKWESIEELAMSYLTNRKISGRSVVLFSDFDKTVALDMPIPCKTALFYGFPQLKQLLFSIDQYKRYLVILPSGSDVKFLELFLTKTTKEMTIKTDLEHFHHFGRKANTIAKERRDLEYEHRFAKKIASDINAYYLKTEDIDRIIFGGDQKEAHAIKNALHPKVKELVITMDPMDFKLSNDEIAKHVKPLTIKYEEQYDMDLVSRLESNYHRSIRGILEVLEAVRAGSVKLLILPYPIDSDLFDELILEATLHGAKIEFVYGEAANRLNKNGGVGAILYYTIDDSLS